MHIPSLIERKRDGGRLSGEEIVEVVRAFTAGELPDYQMSALAMAVVFRGMDAEETAALTGAMLRSGEVLEWPGKGGRRVVDKHSTGGIGDKVSLVLAPLLACDANLWVPMISGRGLGITGGTLDKLESIPGFDVNLSKGRAIAQVEEIGVAMLGQTADICPADKKLYALRDVTGTVPSQALIVASIMSKKLAESLDALVLDVKFGSGAFMKTRPEAEALGAAMVDVGGAMGVRTTACYNPMDEPLGRTVGNALEVSESIRTLRGSGPADLVEVTLDLAEKVCPAGREALAGWLADGTAYAKFLQLVEAQGGDPETIDRFDEVHEAPVRRELKAGQSGLLTEVDAGVVGRVSLELGAGRAAADDEIDPAVGLSEIRKVGEEVAEGEPMAIVHARTEEGALRALAALREGFVVS